MIKELLAYQEADAKLKDIEQVLSESKDRKMANNAKKFMEEYVDNVNKLDDRAAELTVAYEDSVEKQNALRDSEKEILEALKNAEDENELNYLVKKVEQLLNEVKRLSSIAEKVSNEIKTIMREHKQLREKKERAQVQYKEYGEKFNSLRASLADEKAEVEKHLAELAKKVDVNLMKKYKEKRATKVYPVLYKVKEGNICGCCNMQLPLSEISKLKKGELVECGTCGRLLYKED